ncbi:hypothetical protein [Engelhardtia mirabilis]|uniref:Uncharacterized protein n=1 Tax=Engelhardtia mirabilis TaxID=2528011 RepID=A0A518BI33_9BACT|nr:hypothetical protein Pla133_16900 [Planctomycetes bacterium Pla133]QDV00940.1 hypothetical protein Pla86_16890 [Planctomycetes bacterium Pla86]
MNELVIKPARGLFSRDLEVSLGGRSITILERRAFQRSAPFDLAGATYAIARKGWTSGRVELTRAGSLVAFAERKSAFSSRQHVTLLEPSEIPGGALVLRSKGFFSSTSVVEAGDVQLGEIVRRGLFKSGLILRVDERVPPAVAVLLGFIATVQVEDQQSGG